MTSRDPGQVGLFFNYLSCYEEKRYCKDAERVARALQQASNPRLKRVIEFVEALIRTKLVDELRERAFLHTKDLEASRLSRVTQAGLYLCVGELIKQACDVRVASGYSFGYSIGLHAAEVCEIEEEARIFMLSEQYIREIWHTWNTDRLRSTVIYDPRDRETNARFKELAGAYGSIAIKDDRPPYGLQIVGEAAEVEDLRRRYFEAHPGARECSTGMIRSCAPWTTTSS